jgi:TonB family protein
MKRIRKTVAATSSFVVTAALVLAWATRAAAQNEIETAHRALTSAAYEDALATLSRLDVSPSSPEAVRVAKYRALCLLALGRESDADEAVRTVLRADPLYEPDTAEVSATVKGEYAIVRERLLPSVVDERYKQAKAAFDGHDYRAASGQFRTVIDLIDAFPLTGNDAALMTDLRRLSTEFFDLSVKLGTSATPAQDSSDRIYDAGTPGILPPKPIRRALPTASRFAQIVGDRGVVVEVVIDESGSVESAVVRQPMSGGFDEAVVKDVLQWRYEAAVRDGSPVRYRQLVRVSLWR